MSNTTRWFHKPKNRFRMNLDFVERCPFCGSFYYEWNTPMWKEPNPFYYKHERKIIRVKIHRENRRGNKVRLQKDREIEPEIRTWGWLTH